MSTAVSVYSCQCLQLSVSTAVSIYEKGKLFVWQVNEEGKQFVWQVNEEGKLFVWQVNEEGKLCVAGK